MISNSLVRKLHITLIVFIAFISTMPYFVWGYYKETLFVLSFLLFISFTVTINNIKITDLFYFGIITFVLVAYSFIVGASVFFGVLLGFYISVLLALSKNEKCLVFGCFRDFFAISLLPGLIIWCLHHLSGDVSLFLMGYVPDSVVPNQDKVTLGGGYAVYPFCVAFVHRLLNLPVYRFCGMFDEPGVVGTFSALFLVADKVTLKKAKNIILLLSGIASFSLAFFVILASFYLANINKYYIKFLLISIIFAILFSYAIPDDSFVNKLLVERVTISSDGGLKGNNRDSNSIIVGFNEWLNAEPLQFLFGQKEFDADGGASWKLIFISSGLVGGILFFTIIASLIIVDIKFMNYPSFVFVLLFFVSIYQRPNIINPAMITLFCSGFYYLVNTSLYSISTNIGFNKNS